MDGREVDFLILGAGIAGCALADHLRRRDAGSVLVYDPRTPAAGASGRAAGVVTEQLWDRWDVEVTRESHRAYAELSRRWEPEAYTPNGFLRFTADPACAEALEEARERLRGWGVVTEEPSVEEVARWLPAGRFDDVRMTLYSPHDACVRPSSITSMFAEGARARGAEFEFGMPMTDLVRSGDRFELTTQARRVRARRLILAAGAWTKALAIRLGHPIPLSPYRTQAASLEPTPKAAVFPTVHDLDTDVYVRPEGAGHLLAGDGTERTECDPERFVLAGDDAFLAHLAESLERRLPGWSDASVTGAWAGVCTSTPDRHPIVGPVPGADGLYALTGFNGFGVMRAGGVARRLADVLVDALPHDEAEALLGPAWAGRYPKPLPDFDPKPGFTLEPGEHPRW